jgi:hypothetical protein
MFVLNPKHTDYALGHADQPPAIAPCQNSLFFAVWTLTWCAVLLLLVGVPAWLQQADYRALRVDGLVAPGVVISRSGDSQPSYVRFDFTTLDEREITGQALGRAAYRDHAVEDEVAVRYLPAHPATNTIEGYYFVPLWQRLGLPALLLLTPLVVAWTVIQGRRLVQFRRQGRRVPGEVVAAAVAKDDDGDLQLTVEYAFIEPETGKRLSASETIPRKLNPKAPAPGAEARVFYLDDKTFRLL